MADARTDTDRPARPTFLLSSERSGSNLLRSILDTHSEISAPHPLETAYPWEWLADPAALSARKRRKLVRDVVVNKRYSFHPLTVALDPASVADRVERHEEPTFLTVQSALYQEACQAENTSVWASKSPGHWNCLDEALAYYDDLRIVYLVRDVRGVVLAFKTSNIELFHPYLSGQRWQEEQSKGVELLDRLDDDRIHLVQYEQLLEDPETVVEGICEFLDLPYEEAMLYFYETEDAQEAADSADVFENLSVPIKSDNYGKFHDRLPDDEVLITESVAWEGLEHFGYDLVHDVSEIEAFEPDVDAYHAADDRLERQATRGFWRESPREQIRRSLSRSFTAYMVLRYGLLA